MKLSSRAAQAFYRSSKEKNIWRLISQKPTVVNCKAISSSINKSCKDEHQNLPKYFKQPSQFIDGQFVNPWRTFQFPSVDVLTKLAFLEENNSNIPSQMELDSTLPILTPDYQLLSNPPSNTIITTWIGHATVLIQFEGISVLTDPIFSNSCSPLQFFGPKRYREAPCNIKQLPAIDAVCISHNHYDHLDYNSVMELERQFHNQLVWFVPLGLKSWFKECRCKHVIELDWWEECKHPFHSNINFIFTPSCHWSKRSLFDTCKSLWGGWIIKGSTFSNYFAGDSGYCEVFKHIGHFCGPFDVSEIPIGCYLPRNFMRHQHVNTEEAVKIHRDVKSEKSLGIHWGTFSLSYEHYLEPRQKLPDVLAQYSISQDDFFVLNHGQSKILD